MTTRASRGEEQIKQLPAPLADAGRAAGNWACHKLATSPRPEYEVPDLSKAGPSGGIFDNQFVALARLSGGQSPHGQF